MEKSTLLQRLEKINGYAKATKLYRLLKTPYKYTKSILYRSIGYKYFKKPITVSTTTFYGEKMIVKLPASTDIYLTGAKTHDSEIRLAKYMINELDKSKIFVDIGAHYGYFSLLATSLLQNGKIISIEAAQDTFEVLHLNLKHKSQVQILNNAVSNNNEETQFYQFPNLYSEYNSLNIRQYKTEKWFQKAQPKLITIPAIKIDTILQEYSSNRITIKIDVEGNEYKVLEGGLQSFSTNPNIIIIMEYQHKKSEDEVYARAVNLLLGKGFKAYSISDVGALVPLDDIETYFKTTSLNSDNFVFKIE